MLLPNLEMFRVSVAGKRIGLASFEWDYYGMFVEEFRAYLKGYDTGQVNLVLPNLWQRPGTGYYWGPVYDFDEDRNNDCILHLGSPSIVKIL
jgi:hypothetical protein